MFISVRLEFIFRLEKNREKILHMYRRKAKRDYDEMNELRTALEKGNKPRKKHRNSNCFVNTKLSYRFHLGTMAREEATEHAVGNRVELVTGCVDAFICGTCSAAERASAFLADELPHSAVLG